jgi:hypothetical protein
MVESMFHFYSSGGESRNFCIAWQDRARFEITSGEDDQKRGYGIPDDPGSPRNIKVGVVHRI